MEILGIVFVILGLIFIMCGLGDFSLNLILSTVLLGIGLGCITLGIVLVRNSTSNPPYRFKPIPKPKTIDTLYYNVEVKNDSIITTLKTYKTK